MLQGYDAYALKADVQVGGSDQLFNIVTASRKVMTYLGEKPNIAIILGILPGTDGVIRMSKSLGNHIPINTSAEDMYGKVMSIPDTAMPIYSRLVTRWTPEQIQELEVGLNAGSIHPRDAKMKLAHEIASLFYGEPEAVKAESIFVNLFQKNNIPDQMPEYALKSGQTLLDILLDTKLVLSKSEGRRLIQQNGVKLDGEVLKDGTEGLPHPGVLQVGKRHFLRINK